MINYVIIANLCCHCYTLQVCLLEYQFAPSGNLRHFLGRIIMDNLWNYKFTVRTTSMHVIESSITAYCLCLEEASRANYFASLHLMNPAVQPIVCLLKKPAGKIISGAVKVLTKTLSTRHTNSGLNDNFKGLNCNFKDLSCFKIIDLV